MGGGWRALCGEGGGERRGNSLPREGLQLCVAPYFATRGRGDMRGGRGGVPPKSHPGGGAGLSHPPWCVSCCVSMLCGVMTACHRLRGGILGVPIGGPRMSPTPRSAKYGATHSFNPCRGWGNVRLWSSASRGARCAMLASRADAALRRIGGSQPLLRCASSARGWGQWGEWAATGGVHALRERRLAASSRLTYWAYWAYWAYSRHWAYRCATG